MIALRVEPARGLRGIVGVPAGTVSVVAATVIAALATGRSRLEHGPGTRAPSGWLQGLEALGAVVERRPWGLEIAGVAGRFRAPSVALPLPADEAAAAALLGLLAGQPFAAHVAGVTPGPRTRRVLSDVARVLRRRGANLEGQLDASRPDELDLPISARGRELSALELEVDLAAPHEKIAALASGLVAAGATSLVEPLVSDDRFERALSVSGYELASAGGMLHLGAPTGPGDAIDARLPGDAALAAWLLAAAGVSWDDGSASLTVGVRDVGVGPARAGFAEALRDAGALVAFTPTGQALGEPVFEGRLEPGPLRPLHVGGERALRVGCGPMPLAALAARARGGSTIADFAHEELAQAATLLARFDVETDLGNRVLTVAGAGPRRLRAARVDAEGSPTTAMGAVVLALGADGPSTIDRAEGIAEYFPRFVALLRGLGARIDVFEGRAP